jgi:hypothetical protein
VIPLTTRERDELRARDRLRKKKALPAPVAVSETQPPTPEPEASPREKIFSAAKSSGGLSGLAALEYRHSRDSVTGKIIDAKPEGQADAFVREALQAGRGEERRPRRQISSTFSSMRDVLMLHAEDLIALFDESPVTKIGEREVFAETDFLVPARTLEHRVERLKKLVAASKSMIDGLSVRVMKVRRDADNILDKATREKYKREESARMARSNAKLSRYRAALRDGNYHEKIWRHQTQAVYLRDLVDDSMTFTDFGEAYYADGQEKRVEGLVTHTTTEMVRDVTQSRIFDVSRYELVMKLDDDALHLLGDSEDEQKRSWAYWQRWENAVIKAAVFHGVLRPRKNLLELLALSPYVQAALNASDGEIEADDTENALALKTGGAVYGGGIKSGGYRFRNGGFRRRGLETFDKGKPPRGERDADGLEWQDSGLTNLRNVNDDAESYQPN